MRLAAAAAALVVVGLPAAARGAICKFLASNSPAYTTQDCQDACNKKPPLASGCQMEFVGPAPSTNEYTPYGTCYTKYVLSWLDINEWRRRWPVIDNVSTPHQCQTRCQEAADCVWFMWRAPLPSNYDAYACALVGRRSAKEIMSGDDCPNDLCNEDAEWTCVTCDKTVVNGCVYHGFYLITGPKVCEPGKNINKDFCTFDPNVQPDAPMPDPDWHDITTTTTTTTTAEMLSTTAQRGRSQHRSAWRIGILAGGGFACALAVTYTLFRKKQPPPEEEKTQSRLDDMGITGGDVLPPEDPERPFWQ